MFTVSAVNQDSTVGTAKGYGLGSQGSILEKGKRSYSAVLRSIQTISEAHLAFCPMGSRGSFLWGKAGGALPLSSL